MAWKFFQTGSVTSKAVLIGAIVWEHVLSAAHRLDRALLVCCRVLDRRVCVGDAACGLYERGAARTRTRPDRRRRNDVDLRCLVYAGAVGTICIANGRHHAIRCIGHRHVGDAAHTVVSRLIVFER